VRFVLDNDVDARVGGVLRRNGHDCWSSTAGLAASADDDAVTVYADNRDAVVITHDREFTQRRMRNTIGRHVRLNCEHPDGPKVIAARLAELVAELEEEQNIVLVVSASKVERHPARWE
jgi:predicted nuclease of predicted toxin-antitoxin system